MIVFYNPSSNETFGSHPSNSFAFDESEYILQISLGLYSISPIPSSEVEPEYSAIFFTRSAIETSQDSPPPILIACPIASSFVATAKKPSTVFSTKLNSLVCSPFVVAILYPFKAFTIRSGITAEGDWYGPKTLNGLITEIGKFFCLCFIKAYNSPVYFVTE